jgi:hypothetical protein
MYKLHVYQTNVCKEILDYPKTTLALKKLMPKYKFSRKWFVADFDTAYYSEVDEWCKEQFGPHPKYPDVWSRWVHTYENQIHFRDQKDYNWFVLRWGA